MTAIHDAQLKKLSARFDVDDVQQRTQKGMKLDYISIDATIRRFNDVLGAGWSFEITDFYLDTSPSIPKDKNGNAQYIAQCQGKITALGKTAHGVGCDIATDPDKAMKTALAEALKKAGHQFGVGLYLWNEDDRNTLKTVRDARAAGDSLIELKALVLQKARDEGIAPDPELIAEHFGVAVPQLQDADELRKILAVV